ncbi:MAG: hypothetical protein ACE5KJ_07575 [Candidatus Zixiibacteriota bacterium]
MSFSDWFNGDEARMRILHLEVEYRSSAVEARESPKYRVIPSRELLPAPEGVAGWRAKT